MRAGRLIALMVLGVALKLLILLAAAAAFGGVGELCRFDCVWYLHLARDGYDTAPPPGGESDMTDLPFSPLYPLLIRLGTLLGLAPLGSALGVSAVALACFLLVALRYRDLTRPGRDGARFVGAVLLFPWSLYLSLPYTEALYAALTVLVLWSHRRRAALATGGVTALLTATRPTGILLVPYLVVTMLWRGRVLLARRLPSRWGALADLVFPIALMPLGLALFMAYLGGLTGDALASVHAQASWNRHLENPLRVFYWNITVPDWGILLQEAGPESRAFSVAWVVPAALGCAWLLWRRLAFEAWILGITTVVALSAGAESVARYVAASPVFLLLVGDVADRIGPRWLRLGLGALCLLVQAVLLHRWLLASRMMI